MRSGFHQLAFFLFLIAIFFCGALVVHAADGWELLWHNQQTQARTAFHATLAEHPNDSRALFGLAMLADAEGDEVTALQAWGQYYQLAAASWQAAAYWPRVVELAESTGRYAILDAITRDILATKGAPSGLRASARLAQAEAAERAGHFSEAENRWAQMGYLRQWRIIGPFDNVSKSGFAKQFPPEREIDLDKTYAGLNGESIAWHPLRVVSPDGECEIGTCLGDENESVFYAVTAIYSAKTLPVMLSLDPSGASKVFLNGTVLFTDELYRDSLPLVADPYCVAATLQPGWNTLLVKIASDENITASFAMRFTTRDGENIPGLRLDPLRAKSVPLTALPASSAVESATASPCAKRRWALNWRWRSDINCV